MLCRVVGEPSPSDRDLVELGAVSPRRPEDHRRATGYFDFLRDSRASIASPGGGFDTARFWEIVASSTLLISRTVTLEFPNPLLSWEHYVPFDTLTDLDVAIRFVHDEPDRADEIRRAGQAHALEHHSPDARATYVVDTISSSH